MVGLLLGYGIGYSYTFVTPH